MRYVLKRALCFIFCLSIGIAGWSDSTVIAASADIEFFTEDMTAEAGREFTLILEISSDMTIGDFEGYFTYDAEIAEYLYGPACITGGDGYLKISDINASPSFGLRSYAMTFTAKKHGICQFKMSGIPVVYAYDSGNSMSVAAEPYQLTVNAASDASDNAEIVALKVSPGVLNPAFSPEITEYEVDLEPLTERLIVSAVAADVRALVSISGNESLAFGENDVNVTVTAEDGTVRVYHILAKRAREGTTPAPTAPIEQDKDKPEPSKPAETKAFYLTPDKQMLCGNYRYQLAQDIAGLTIPEGYEADYLLVDGESIPAYMTSRQSEYCLLALINEAGETGLYRFDRKEYTLQRYEPEIIKVADTSGISQKLNELLEQTRDYEQRKNNMSILCGLLGVGIVVLLLLCVKMGIRRRGYEDEL